MYRLCQHSVQLGMQMEHLHKLTAASNSKSRGITTLQGNNANQTRPQELVVL